MDISIFSVSDKRPKNILYVQLNSIKHYKKQDTIIHYFLLIEDVDSEFTSYFEDLISPDFIIHFIDARYYEKYINPPRNSYLYYVRCLAPIIFPYHFKVLYLDTDILMINEGIEDLWTTDINNYYLVASIDIEEAYRDVHERINVKKNTENNTYFNSGVMLMNLSNLRNGGFDYTLMNYLKHWPEELECILFDQTLLNWIFNDTVKIIDSKYNNSILSMVYYDRIYYENYYNTINLLDMYQNACFLHFKGNKVWDDLPQNVWIKLPHYEIGQKFYLEYYSRFSKNAKQNN